MYIQYHSTEWIHNFIPAGNNGTPVNGTNLPVVQNLHVVLIQLTCSKPSRCITITYMYNSPVMVSKRLNRSWPGVAICRHRTGSTLAQIMTCYLMAPSHCLNQRWLLIIEGMWHSHQSNFTASAQSIILCVLCGEFENHTFKITTTYHRRHCVKQTPWWRHPMETFSALPAICAGNSPVTGEFPAQRPVTRSFDVFFDLRLNKRLSKFTIVRLVIWDAIAPIMTSQ